MSQRQFKKGAAVLLAGVLSVSSVVPAFAYAPDDTANYDHITTAGNVGNAAVMLTVEDREEPVIFSAYVPAELPIAIDVNGDVTVPENAKIINGVENLPIAVEAIDVTMDNGWELTSMDTDMSLEEKDTKKVAMEVLGQDLADADSFSPAKIEANGELALGMQAKLPNQSASSQTKIATIGFTMNWWEAENTHLLSSERMRAVLQPLTGSIVFSTEGYDPEQHTGTATDISEAQDGSVMAVVNGQDAVVYSEGGTLAPESCGILFGSTGGADGVPDGSQYNCSYIDLTGLDTSNVTNMGGMFRYNQNLKEINFTNFDTSKVTVMDSMFYGLESIENLELPNFDTTQNTSTYCMFKYCTNLKTLDVSSMDLSKVNRSDYMFFGCPSLTTVYCRTNEDATKMRTSPYCPSSINFIVK